MQIVVEFDCDVGECAADIGSKARTRHELLPSLVLDRKSSR
jgi:hypothetical protein